MQSAQRGQPGYVLWAGEGEGALAGILGLNLVHPRSPNGPSTYLIRCAPSGTGRQAWQRGRRSERLKVHMSGVPSPWPS